MVFLTSFAALLFGGIFLSCSNSQKDSVEKDEISLGLSSSLNSIPLVIALEKGFFADEGLDVTVQKYPSGKLAMQAMLDGKIDFAPAADLPIIFNIFRGEKFCIPVTFSSSFTSTKILARKDADIRSAITLKNKRVGANKGTTSQFYLGAFLTDNGLSMSDIELVHYNTVDLPDALNKNEVDAISVWVPLDQKARKLLGDNLIELKAGEICRTTFSLVVNNDFKVNRRSAVEKMIRALHEAANYSKTNRSEAITIIAENFSVDRESVESVWDEFKFGTFLDQAFLIGLDDMARWSIENEFIQQQKVPNFYNYICPEFLESIYPEEVSIIR